ncbi:MAG: hypothetical protein IH888_03875, partial [Planctomycetes bacterium]|nr:hypothetical protein [Planctomycetota bacterium]
MKKVSMCIRAGGPWALAGAVAVSLPAAFTPAAAGQCNNVDPSPDCADAQIGLISFISQQCDGLGGSDDPDTPEDNDGWWSLAFPIQTGGASIDGITFTLNTNRAGGDLWIMGNTDAPLLREDCPGDCQADPRSGGVDVPDLLALLAAWGGPPGEGTTCDLTGGEKGEPDDVVNVPDLLALLARWGPCGPPSRCGQPDVTNVLAQICCALEGLESDDGFVLTLQTINFPNVTTSSTEPTWVVFVPRTGRAGLADIDGDGTGDLWHFDGTSGTAFSIARRCDPDPDDTADPPRCLAVSSPNHAFINLT